MKFSNLAQVCATLGSAVALATVVLMAEDKPRVRLFWEVVGGVFFGGGGVLYQGWESVGQFASGALVAVTVAWTGR